MTRHPNFLLYTVGLPSTLISLLALCTFWLPVNCGEKITFVISLLLGLTVFLLVMENHSPEANVRPIMMTYMSMNFIFVGVIIFLTVITVTVNASRRKIKHPQLRQMLLKTIPRMLCVSTGLHTKESNENAGFVIGSTSANEKAMENKKMSVKSEEVDNMEQDQCINNVASNKGRCILCACCSERNVSSALVDFRLETYRYHCGFLFCFVSDFCLFFVFRFCLFKILFLFLFLFLLSGVYMSVHQFQSAHNCAHWYMPVGTSTTCYIRCCVMYFREEKCKKTNVLVSIIFNVIKINFMIPLSKMIGSYNGIHKNNVYFYFIFFLHIEYKVILNCNNNIIAAGSFL